MTFLWPWSLLAGALVVGAALWALHRPWRRVAVVGSLALWEKALGALGWQERRRSRRVSLSWLCLLLGAIAAVLAAANPTWFHSSPARRITIAPVASAELSGPGGTEEMRSAMAALLNRLAPHDQVRLLLPAPAGGDSGWLSVPQAQARLADVRLLPARAADIAPQGASGDSQHIYYFVPAGTPTPAGPKFSTVELSTEPVPTTIQAIGTEALAGGKVQVFMSVRRGNMPNDPYIAVSFLSASGKQTGKTESWYLISDRFVQEAQASEAMAFRGSSPGDEPGTSAYLVHRPAQVRKVAMVGPDNPLIRRFIQVDAALRLVSSADQADLVIANATTPPADKPALVIAPPDEPAGWRWGKAMENVPLKQLDVAASAEVMRDVRLEGVVVRRLRMWIPGDDVAQKVLAAWKKEAVILQDDGAAGQSPRRVYVAFDLDARNTNFGMSSDFVVFLANVVRYLAPDRQGQERYEYQTPIQAGPQKDWVRLAGSPPPAEASAALPWPGIYKDRDGELHAINLLGLQPGTAAKDPKDAVAALPLPPPEQIGFTLALWPMLLGAGLVLWLLGWGLRLR
jgi:hypothetical protein